MDYNALMQEIIARGGYVLATIEERIDRLWMEGKITTEQRTALLSTAANNADDALQIDIVGKIADLEQRVYLLEHPDEQYVIWTYNYPTKQHEIVRYDVTGDGVLDLCQYNGGRSETTLRIGQIAGWNMLNAELQPTHTIDYDKATQTYTVTPIASE